MEHPATTDIRRAMERAANKKMIEAQTGIADIDSAIPGIFGVTIEDNLRSQADRDEGITIDDDEDALYVEGGEIIGGTVSSRGDHRIAMSAAVAGLCSREGVTIEDAEAVAKSYPTFWEDLKSLTNNAVRYE